MHYLFHPYISVEDIQVPVSTPILQIRKLRIKIKTGHLLGASQESSPPEKIPIEGERHEKAGEEEEANRGGQRSVPEAGPQHLRAPCRRVG